MKITNKRILGLGSVLAAASVIPFAVACSGNSKSEAETNKDILVKQLQAQIIQLKIENDVLSTKINNIKEEFNKVLKIAEDAEERASENEGWLQDVFQAWVEIHNRYEKESNTFKYKVAKKVEKNDSEEELQRSFARDEQGKLIFEEKTVIFNVVAEAKKAFDKTTASSVVELIKESFEAFQKELSLVMQNMNDQLEDLSAEIKVLEDIINNLNNEITRLEDIIKNASESLESFYEEILAAKKVLEEKRKNNETMSFIKSQWNSSIKSSLKNTNTFEEVLNKIKDSILDVKYNKDITLVAGSKQLSDTIADETTITVKFVNTQATFKLDLV